MTNFEIAKPPKLSPYGLQCYAKITLFYPSRQSSSQKTKKAKKPQAAKERYRLINWPEYNKALISRGLVTLWLSEDTLANWYYQGPRAPGGLFRYSDECI